MNTKYKKYPIIFICIFIVISALSAYYKFIVIQEFTVIYFTDCEADSMECFVNTDECDQSTDIEECTYFYTATLVSQPKQLTCTPDEGECLLQFCQDNTDQCTTLTCNPEISYEHYGIYDSCME